jgi:hypothetical protein
MKLFAFILACIVAGCSTRISQNAGGDALVTISTHTAVSPATALGSNPVASVDVTEVTSRK